MKEEIKNLKMGTGSRVCSEASTGVGLGSGTFARRPLLSSWRTETWIPKKWNSKGWITDFTKRNIHGITDSQTGPILDDLEKMIPQEVSKMH